MPTKMTATNTLNKGLVMDFNPLITKDDCLTNALNATLLTFNGNEMQLQQDMGNGRVETAFLPEGYVPVGTCEFGDIIYVVSYNPLENKSQIGCFPSPERNISSDEITDMQQSLAAADFQEFNGNTPTGVLKATSVKKILYGDKNMNPGDKYIIYEEATGDGNLAKNSGTISDFGNTAHTLGTWPKLLKIKVVSIEESGKIVDLGASVKWYDNDYYLTALSAAATGTGKDIDSYRSLVSSAYSVFQSKVSGKLAILAELEAVDSFSCTHDVFTEETTNGVKHYIYFYTSWGSSHPDVNPSGFLITKSSWIETTNGGRLSIPKPVKDGDITKMMYEVGPVLGLPILAGTTTTGYDATKVYGYTRLYDLAAPAATYTTYLTRNYEALLETQVTWKNGLQNGTTANLDELRPITKATRLLQADGKPNLESKYVFNLDSYEREGAMVTYQTKDRQGELRTLAPVVLTDDVVNNYFGKDIPTLISDTFVVEKYTAALGDLKEQYPNDLSNLIWNYSVAPVMPYGVLDWLTINGTIDFSKLGSGQIDLTAWRYYVSGGIATLTWGLEAYPEPNKGIAEVHFDFYDNQGFAAGYKVTGKASFSGVFTENIVLGQKNSSPRMVSVDATGNAHPHAGLEVDMEELSAEVYLNSSTNKPHWLKEGKKTGDVGPFTNDAGTIYPNMLYLVRITVKYTSKDLMGEYDLDNNQGWQTYYRWMWTNGMFNENYYTESDFDNLMPQLGIDFMATFDTRGKDSVHTLAAYTTEYYNPDPDPTELSKNLYRTLGARVYHINQDGSDDAYGNILLTITPSLTEGFNSFNLNKDSLGAIQKVEVSLGQSTITKSIEQPGYIHTGNDLSLASDLLLQPIIVEELNKLNSRGLSRAGYVKDNYNQTSTQVSQSFVNRLLSAYAGSTGTTGETSPSTSELYSSATAYQGYKDAFSLNFKDSAGTTYAVETLEYTNSDGEEVKVQGPKQTFNLDEASKAGIPLTLTGITFSKLYEAEVAEDTTGKTLRPLLRSTDGDYDSAAKLGFEYFTYSGEGHLAFKVLLLAGMGEKNSRQAGYASRFKTTSGANTSGTPNGQWHPRNNGSGLTSGYGPEHKQGDGKVHGLVTGRVQGDLAAAFVNYRIGTFMVARPAEDYDYSAHNIYPQDHQFSKVRVAFGVTNSSKHVFYDESWEAPTANTFEHGDHYCTHTLVLYDEVNSKWYPLNDWFISHAQYQYAYKAGRPKSGFTLADMMGSLLSQLYVVTTEGVSKILYKNTTTLQPYKESWKKDIIVRMDPDSISEEDINMLILLQKMPLEVYYKCLENNLNLSPVEVAKINKTNTQFKLVGMERVISFQFDTSYDVGNLVYVYQELNKPSNSIYLSTKATTGDPAEVQSFTGDVSPNTLYTWSGSKVEKFGANSTLYYAKQFQKDGDRLYAIVGSGSERTAIKSTSFASLSQVMRYVGGELYFENLDKLSGWGTYNIRYKGVNTSDTPGFSEANLASIFHEYKVV